MRPLRFVTHWMPAIVWMILIFLGSTDVLSAAQTSRFIVPFLRWLDPQISWAAIDEIHTLIRKLGHVTEYAILAVFLWRALRGGKNLGTRLSILFFSTWMACALFAASDEFHQSFIPTRTASARDVMIDICGALVGLIICLMFAVRKRSVVVAAVSAADS